jgi:hypothetical protein
MLGQAIPAVLVGVPVALVLAGTASLIAGRTLFGLDWGVFYAAAAQTIDWADFAAGFGIASVDALVLGVPLWFALPTLSARPWSLPVKIVAVCVALLVCRVLISGIVLITSP